MPRKRLPPRMFVGEGGYWHVSYFDEARNRTVSRSLGERGESEARVKFGEWLVRHRPSEIKSTDLNVAALISYYDNEHVEKELMAKASARCQLRHLRSFFGHMSPHDVNAGTAWSYTQMRRTNGAAASTINHELRILRAVFSYAAKHNFGGLNFVPMYAAPPSSPRKEDFLSSAQMETVFQYLRDRRGEGGISDIEAFIVIAYRAAARRGAILDLTWDRVDFSVNQIDFRSPEWKALPLARRSKRRAVVPMSKKLRAFMEELHAQRDPHEPRVISSTVGQIDHRCDVMTRELGFRVAPHLIRRTFGSHAAMTGVKMGDIARIMGNTERVAETNYVRFSPGYLQNAVEID